MGETIQETPATKNGHLCNIKPLDNSKLPTLVVRFVNTLKCSGKSSHTLSAYRNDLGLFLDFISNTQTNLASWNANLQDSWIDYLHQKGRNSQASVRRALMSTRTFLHFLIKEKYIETSPLLEAKSPKQPTHDLVTISPDQFQNLLNNLSHKATEGDEKSIRDLAIIQLLGIAGLKATEAANLTWADVFFGSGQGPQTGHPGSILVKGGNERIIPIDSFFCESLRNLYKLREELELATTPTSNLFFGYMNLSRKTRTHFLHRHGIKFVVYEICNEILGIPFNSESLRNHAISLWISQGLSSERIAELAGYSSLNSLEKFSLEIRSTRLPRRNLARNSNV